LVPLDLEQLKNCLRVDFYLAQQQNMLDGQLYMYNLV